MAPKRFSPSGIPIRFFPPITMAPSIFFTFRHHWRLLGTLLYYDWLESLKKKDQISIALSDDTTVHRKAGKNANGLGFNESICGVCMYIKEYLYIGKVLLWFETYNFYTYTYLDKKCPHFGYVVVAEKEKEKGRVPRPRRLPRPLPFRLGLSNSSLCLLKIARIQLISDFRYVHCFYSVKRK